MNSLILRTASRTLTVVLIVFSLYILFRGHNEPGGGFIGGLLTAGGLVIFGVAHGAEELRRVMRVDPRTVIAVGVLTALCAAIAGPIAGMPFLTGLWTSLSIPLIGTLSTVLLFDVGVHLAVVGSVLLILLALSEER